ncbi:MAG: M48 family metallopeptidase [Chloroflexota bacterium]
MVELDPERQDQAEAYATAMRRLSLLHLLLGGACIVVLLVTPVSIGLRNLVRFPLPLAVALYVALIMAAFEVVSAPLGFYAGFVLPRRFGLLTQSVREWLADYLKRGAVALVLGLAVIVCVYLLLERLPQLWWLVVSALVVLLSVVMTGLAPIAVIPLFYKLEPLADTGLVERLQRLAQRAGTRVSGVFTVDISSKARVGNAALVGLGRTRRIVIADTLLGRYSADEVEVIMAHELGHHVHHDIVRLIVAQSAIVVAGFYLAHRVLGLGVPFFGFEGIADVAAFPLLAIGMGALALFMTPVINAYSRHLESMADRYALTMTGNPEGFIAAITKLTNQNLVEARPRRWMKILLYDHPPYCSRVAMAQSYREGGE